MKPCPNDPATCGCRVCHLWNNDPAYRRHWGGEANGAQGATNDRIKRVRLKCIHIGEPTQNVASCGCAGSMVYSCTKHLFCRLVVKSTDNIRTCFECPDYEAPSV